MNIFKKKTLIKNCSVFISEKHNHLIIVYKMENGAGINYEQENPREFDLSISEENFGQEIIDAMNNYIESSFVVHELKSSDWPAYKSSKSKSLKAFEKDYLLINISNQNEGNIIIDIEGRPYLKSKFWIKSSISFHADKSKIGKQILKTFEICKTGKLF